MIYLDNSATTRPSAIALDAFRHTAESVFGNPSSVHAPGTEAAKLLKAARETVAAAMHAEPSTIYFTSGGTLADNLAVLGAVNPKQGGSVVTTAIEHPAVKSTCAFLEKQGVRVTYVKPGKDGVVSQEAIREALTADTVLVSVMHVNNETGAIMPVEKIKATMQAICPRALFHTDCVQSFGKLPIMPRAWGADFISVSAHKMHGLRGAGALYIAQGVHLRPSIFGGGQEKDIVPGTENLPAIAAFAAACRALGSQDKVYALSARLRQALSAMPGVYINSPQDALPHILNVSFGKLPSEVVTNALSNAGVCVSSGSACAAARSEKSYVLRAMDAPNPDSGVRFSLSDTTTEAEIEEAIRIIQTIIPMLMAAV
ncbi:MAG: cysteine desulfurase family protein [Clostridia bacterium]|nr:cysteine desulfurase family protein [Clostridia bacterium]